MRDLDALAPVLCVADKYEPGSQPPSGYGAWHEWAVVQHRAGLRQSWCVECRTWLFPQERCDHEPAPRLSLRRFNEMVWQAKAALLQAREWREAAGGE